MLSCRNKSRTRKQFWYFSVSKKAQLPEIRITEKPILRTVSTINRLGYKLFSLKAGSQISSLFSSSS